MRRLTRAVIAVVLTAMVLAACSGTEWDASEREVSVDPERAEVARRVVEQAMEDEDLQR